MFVLLLGARFPWNLGVWEGLGGILIRKANAVGSGGYDICFCVLLDLFAIRSFVHMFAAGYLLATEMLKALATC